jgi:hypothetical protein
MDNWILLDRHRGLTLRVPDGRGSRPATLLPVSNSVAGASSLQYAPALCRGDPCSDRLILSGTTKDLASLSSKSETWLNGFGSPRA